MSQAKYRLSSIQAMHGKTVSLTIDELTIAAGELHLLAGSNGSGKSTLLGILAFLNKPQRGTVYFDGAPVSWEPKECTALRRRVTLLHQTPYLFSGSVAANVSFGLVARGAGKESAQSVVRESLERVGLEGFELRKARQLSGGESRRVALARALACKSEVLLLDEPFANVDRASGALLESVVTSLVASGITVVISSHDELLGAKLGARVIRLEDGKLEDGRHEDGRRNRRQGNRHPKNFCAKQGE
jgi:tungstate transport system ATP-binding protein